MMELSTIQRRVGASVQSAMRSLDAYVGLPMIIKHGKFTGRPGVITAFHIDSEGMILAQVRPFRRSQGPPSDLLWNDIDARSFWPICDDDICVPKKD